MNRILFIALISVVLFIVFVSFGMRAMVSNQQKGIVEEIDLKNKESLLELAGTYEASGEYAKARNILREYVGRFPRAVNAAKLKKDIEMLNMRTLFSGIVTERSFLYEIKPGDTLAKIATRFNTTVELLKRSNGLASDTIYPGRSLKITTERFNILVDKSDNRLMLKNEAGEVVKTYTVSTGENLNTPTGTFKIEEKLISPAWYRVGAIVEASSPEYELGSRWLGLSEPGYGIHGTRDESTIGQHITKGCVRMINRDVEELYAIVPSGTEVTIVE
jgi:L,D-transpeptidase ErfK/SrfK